MRSLLSALLLATAGLAQAQDASLLAGFVPQALDGAVQAAHIALLTQSRLITAMFCRIRGIDGRTLQGFEKRVYADLR